VKVSVERQQQAFARVGSPNPGDSGAGDKSSSPKPVPPVQQQPTPKPSPAPASPTTIPPVRVQPTPTPSASSEPAKSQSKVEIPMKSAKSLDGVISYLTKKHCGNVQEKGIVTITSKSVWNDDPDYAPKNVADLTSDSRFVSQDEPGQSVCWDFREMRVRPTHYTIWTSYLKSSSDRLKSSSDRLKSWVVEGSLDGRSWTVIDRQTDNQDFKGGSNTVSFAVSKPAEFRFIRLTQTDKRHDGYDYLTHKGGDKNHYGCDYLLLYAVEFFGTLSE
jgi:hypothetical protein